MYEMEGASSDRAAPDKPVTWPFPALQGRPPVPRTRARGRFPDPSHVPELPPGWYPFPTVKYFYSLAEHSARDYGKEIINFLQSTYFPQNTGSYSQPTEVIHCLVHNPSTGYME